MALRNCSTIWNMLTFMEKHRIKVPSCRLPSRECILMMPEWLWIKWELPFAQEHIVPSL